MAFPEDVVLKAWRRSGGRCECKNTTHGHSGRCPKQLDWDTRGEEEMPGGWEAHRIVSIERRGSDTLSNCKILCCDCHKKTQTYGG